MKKILLIISLFISLFSSSQNQRHNGVNPNTTYTLIGINGPSGYTPLGVIRSDTVYINRSIRVLNAGLLVTPTLSGDSALLFSIVNGSAVLGQVFANTGNSGTTETDLYSFSVPANTLTADGESVNAWYGGTFTDLTATVTLKAYFGATTIFNTGSLTVSAAGGWKVEIDVIRSGTTTARAIVSASTPGASTAVYTTQTDITSLDFTGAITIRITGTAGGGTGGSNDILLTQSKIAKVGIAQ